MRVKSRGAEGIPITGSVGELRGALQSLERIQQRTATAEKSLETSPLGLGYGAETLSPTIRRVVTKSQKFQLAIQETTNKQRTVGRRGELNDGFPRFRNGGTNRVDEREPFNHVQQVIVPHMAWLMRHTHKINAETAGTQARFVPTKQGLSNKLMGPPLKKKTSKSLVT